MSDIFTDVNESAKRFDATYDVLFGEPRVCVVCEQPAVTVLYLWQPVAVCENHLDHHIIEAVDAEMDLV